MSETERGLLGNWALVVSNDRALAERARIGLSGLGMFCDCVKSGRVARDRLESPPHQYAVIVVDADVRDVAPRDIELVAAMNLPDADVVQCGIGPADRAYDRGASIAKPLVASELAHLVAALRAEV